MLFKQFHPGVNAIAQQCKVQLLCATFIYGHYGAIGVEHYGSMLYYVLCLSVLQS